MLQDFIFVIQLVVSKFCLAITELSCFIKHYVFTAMHWLLSPEPPKAPLIVPITEDLLVSDEYLSTEYKQDWLRSSLHLSPCTIQVIIQQTCNLPCPMCLFTRRKSEETTRFTTTSMATPVNKTHHHFGMSPEVNQK